MEMFLGGTWQTRDRTQRVQSPFDGSVVDTVPEATAADIDAAIHGLVRGAGTMRELSQWDRGRILSRAAASLREHSEDFARTISREEGKPIRESRTEALRAADVLELSAEEARRLAGEMLPMDGAEAGRGKLGFTLRSPCGVVAAITPFNFPLNLVAHKLGPSIAGGNATLIKPASNTPLSALKLTKLLLESGLPAEAIACVTGPGGELGEAIARDPRVRKISFTGSYEVGERICQAAGVKRVTMELGGNSPVIVMDDADIELAATALAIAGYSNAGQVCISAQRVIAEAAVKSSLVEALQARLKKHVSGDPLSDETTIGPLVRESDAERVEQWLKEDAARGARLIGGTRRGAFIEPAILDGVTPDMRIAREELFGPAVGVITAGSTADAIRLANASPYGLSAGVFTRDLDRAMAFARGIESGCIHLNWSSQWRADFMPYGGLKHSGFGKEGPRSALREMTEEKTIVLHLVSPK